MLRFTANDVTNVIKKMRGGKSPGHDSLGVEHLRFTGPRLSWVLALLYSFYVSHSYLPNAMMRTTNVTIIKHKTSDVANIFGLNQYRSISLATIIARFFHSLHNLQLTRTRIYITIIFGFRPWIIDRKCNVEPYPNCQILYRS